MKNPYLADSSAEKNPEAERKYSASDVQRIAHIFEQLVQENIPFVAQNDMKHVWIRLEGLDPEECKNAFTRAENDADYWLVEAPGRSEPG